jgi:secondary thiamine-phosphate synthase enzyme
VVTASKVHSGQVTVWIQHTSASLIIYENADPTARADLLAYFAKLVPEDDPGYTHTAEGLDDTTSHLRYALTQTSLVIPVVNGQMTLGTWQGIFVFEHRRSPHQRRVVVNVIGL